MSCKNYLLQTSISDLFNKKKSKNDKKPKNCNILGSKTPKNDPKNLELQSS